MKRLILVVLLIVVIAGGIFGLQELLRYHTVTFSMSKDTTGAVIYEHYSDSIADKSTASVKPGESIRLREGSYVYIPEGKAIDSTQVIFNVAGDKTITVDPNYSDSYLYSLISTEREPITKALAAKYPNQMKQYAVNNLKLLIKGNYAGVVLTPIGMDPQNPAGYYRVLLKKGSTAWEVVGRPEIVLTKYNIPNTSIEILTSINDLPLN